YAYPDFRSVHPPTRDRASARGLVRLPRAAAHRRTAHQVCDVAELPAQPPVTTRRLPVQYLPAAVAGSEPASRHSRAPGTPAGGDETGRQTRYADSETPPVHPPTCETYHGRRSGPSLS